jgi:hypothetical protein
MWDLGFVMLCTESDVGWHLTTRQDWQYHKHGKKQLNYEPSRKETIVVCKIDR